MIHSPVSSLFKANRRTMVAEMTLMIVIVISFSWSAYALYKLFAGGSESLFGYSLASASKAYRSLEPMNNISNKSSTRSKDVIEPNPSIRPNSRHTNQFDRDELEHQLADYKSKILSELLARQESLLGRPSSGASQDLLSLLASGQLSHRTNIEPENYVRQSLNIGELERWKGGYKMPSSLDYLFEGKRTHNHQPARSKFQEDDQSDRMPLSSMNSHAAVAEKSNLPHRRSLVSLTDAPSLMQLSPTGLPSGGMQSQFTTPEPAIYSNDASSGAEIGVDNQIISSTTTVSPQQIDDTETTTSEPSYSADESVQDEVTPVDDEIEDDDQQPENQNHGERDPSSDRDDKATDESMERVRNASRSIDEDVDRMTQPSLGMTSRQDKPSDLLKDGVHFDDGPISRPSNIRDILTTGLKRLRNSDSNIVAPGTHPETIDSGRAQPGDLLVADDDRLKSPISATSEPGIAPRHDRNSEKYTGRDPVKSSPEQSTRLSSTRRSHDRDKARAPPKRTKRDSLPSNDVSMEINYPNTMSAGTRGASKRRSDEDSDDAEDDETSTDDRDSRDLSRGLTSDPPRINSPTLEELLAHKQLLDALQQSQLPAPVVGGASRSAQSQALNRTSPLQIIKTRPVDGKNLAGDDHQSADTQYSVDHGLLLYPASGEEHGHKSVSHKSGKSSKKKGKKKMTSAVKKGGHKNKKHKKEEKKYIKEKRFKGAKKGKKMSKGKGGKGGKKGKKFYKDKGFKKKGFKNIYVKNEFGQKKSYFDEFRNKDFKKKWKNFDDKYNYAQMKKWQAKDVKGAKKMKDHGEHHKKYDKGRWKKNYHKHMESEMAKKKKKSDDF